METKKWYQSLTIWGIAILGIGGLALPLLGKAEYALFVQQEQAGIIEWLGLLSQIIGGAIAFYGRFRAIKKIG